MHFTMINRMLLLLLICLPFYSKLALASDIAEKMMPSIPTGFLNVTYFKPSQIKDSDDIEFSQLDTHFKIPFAKVGDMEDEGGMFLYSFNFREREIIINDHDNIYDNKQRLYDISVPITYVAQTDDETRYIFNLSPGVKSSLEYVNTKDFAVNAVAQIAKTYEQHEYQYGLVFTHAFGVAKLIPLAAYRYKPTANWDMTIGFPVSYISYAPNWGQNYFAKVTPNGGSWHVYKDGNKDETFDYIQQGYRLGLGAQWNIAGPFWFEIESGLQFGQELELEDQDSTVVNAQFDNTSYIQLGINLHFGGPDQK